MGLNWLTLVKAFPGLGSRTNSLTHQVRGSLNRPGCMTRLNCCVMRGVSLVWRAFHTAAGAEQVGIACRAS